MNMGKDMRYQQKVYKQDNSSNKAGHNKGPKVRAESRILNEPGEAVG